MRLAWMDVLPAVIVVLVLRTRESEPHRFFLLSVFLSMWQI